ncbi:MAG: Rne/Rng family ribonuclease [SAR324 cluster bacterium]|nr:Rne/Rng family ribonuclease [SAR324 cluster bacterium]
MTEVDQKILINVEDDETRIALVHGSTLNNLYIEQTHHTQKVGNIYCGKVVKVQPSFQAAFIDYGEERHGFLSLSDINFQVYKPNQKGRGRPSITQILKPGQKVLVQVVKDEIAHKGASLTTNISLAGRFLVFMPDSERGGVSRKIEDEEQRSRLRHLLKGLGGEDSSAIIRTVGVDRSLTELKRDFMILRRTWNEIKDEYEEQSALGLLYQEENAMVRMIRDYYHENISEVVIDEPVAFQRALEFFQAHMPKDQKKLQLYLGEKSLFSSYDIEGHIEVLHHKQVPLPSGGSLVIMPTEALVAIDVNSGRSTQERNIEATALRTNLEAAEEVAKQLRLRNLGGLIVVDFIDMDNSKNRLSVEKKIEEAMSADKAKTSFGEISKFGLLELSRQRISGSLARNSVVLTLVNRILRKIHDSAVEQKVLQVHIRLPLEIASHLLNVKRQRLTQMEMDYGIRISITPDTSLGSEEIPEMEVTLREQDGEETRTSVPISASDMRDEKPEAKKGRQKKEVAKKDSATAAPGSLEMKNKEKQSKQISNDTSKPSSKSKGKSLGTDTSLTKEHPDSGSEVEKDNEKLTATEKQRTPEVETKQKAVVKKQETKEKTDVELFTSVHEPLEVKVSPIDKKSPQKQIVEKKREPETPAFKSVHLEDKSNSTKITQRTVNETSKNDVVETPMFSSVHITDTVQSAPKIVSIKKDSKSRETSGKTKSDSATKSGKTSQGKPKAIKTATKKQDYTKVTRAQTDKTKGESKAVSGTKPKSARNKVQSTKKETNKSTSSRSYNRKNLPAAKSKQESKTKQKTENLPKILKETKPSEKSPK